VAIESGFIGKKCQVAFPYRWSAGVAGDILVKVIFDDGAETDFVITELNPTIGSDVSQFFQVFDCPTTGTTQMQLSLEAAVADPAAVIFDNSFLGTGRNEIQIAEAELYAAAYYPITASCTWLRNSPTMGAFSPVAACPSILPMDGYSGVIDTTDDDLPNIVLPDAPPGNYYVEVHIPSGFSAVEGHLRSFSISDSVNGTTLAHTCQESFNSATGSTNLIADICSTTVQITERQTLQFDVFAAETGPTGGVEIENSFAELSFKVFRFPLNSQAGNTYETSGFYISAIWENGANYALGTITQGDTSAGTSTGVLTALEGSAQIPCDGSPSVGSTCPAVNERVGVSWIADTSGLYETCMSYSIGQQVDSGGNIDVIVNLARVTDGTDTVLRYGEDRSTHQLVAAGGAAVFKSTHASLCETEFLNAGRHTYHYRREQSASGTVLENRIEAGRVYFTVKKLNQSFPTPVFNDLQNSLDSKVEMLDGESGVKYCFFTVFNTDSAPTLSGNIGGCVDSISDTGTGEFTANFVAGAFDSGNYICQCTARENSMVDDLCISGSRLATSHEFGTVNVSGTKINSTADVFCVGK
jgi:hypothetical protein